MDAEPARIGVTQAVETQDAYGRGPIARQLTAVRGLIRPGNSGGPVVDESGDVLTTIFAATTAPARAAVSASPTRRSAPIWRTRRNGFHGGLHG